MKNRLCIVLGLLFCFAVCGCSSAAMAMDTAPIYVNDKKVTFDTTPFIERGLLMVPIRGISEAISVPITWDEQKQQATITRNADKLVLTIGQKYALYNNVKIPLEIAPQIKNNRTFLPLRFIAEWLLLDVDFKNGNAYLKSTPSLEIIDTMSLLKGNSNGNLANGGSVMLVDNSIYSNFTITDSLIKKDLNSGQQTTIAQGAYAYFNLWDGQLYVLKNHDFVKLSVNGAVIQTVVSGVSYCQIQDNRLYYVRNVDEQLCSVTLDKKEVKELGIFSPQKIVMTDQHIYTYVKADNGQMVLLQTDLEGNQRKRLSALDDLTTIDYMDGYLYFNLNTEAEARICRIKTDGTGMQIISQTGADGLNAFGGWLYFSRIDKFTVLDNGKEIWQGVDLCRMKGDGTQLEQLTGKTGYLQYFANPTLLDGRLFYENIKAPDIQEWQELKN